MTMTNSPSPGGLQRAAAYCRLSLLGDGDGRVALLQMLGDGGPRVILEFVEGLTVMAATLRRDDPDGELVATKEQLLDYFDRLATFAAGGPA